MKKRLFLSLGLFLFSFGLLQGLISFTKKDVAYAEVPRCYTINTATNPATVKSYECKTHPIFQGFEDSLFGGNLKNDHCYIWWGIRVLELPSNNEFCVNAKGNAQGGEKDPSDESNPGGAANLFNTGQYEPDADTCGDSESAVKISIDVGCTGEGNGIVDLTFAIIRFLSIGVGILAVGSIILGAIQYSASGGSPETAAKAIERISNTAIALLIYFLIFAILNWIVPGGVF